MNFDSSEKFMEATWTTPVTMEREEYREVMKSFLQVLQECKPKKLLTDSRGAGYVIVPNDQDWINTNIYPQAAQAGLSQIAFVLGADLFVSISLEQMADDSQENKDIKEVLRQRFFDDYDKAKKWLLS